MKEILALILAAGLAASACTNPTTEPGKTEATTGEQTTVQTASVKHSDEEIEKRINEVGKEYDGLYEYGEDNAITFGSLSMKSRMTNSPASNSEMVQEDGLATDEAFLPYEVVPETDWNTEGYNEVKDNGLISVQTQPFSTFGADTDTAVYSNLRRRFYENDGHGITDNAIRYEELINYFNYNYPEPKEGEKFAAVTDLTACPWVDDKETMLLRVGIKADSISADKGSNIVFLVDTSGSMFFPNKLPLVQKSLKMLQEQFTDNDTISIVTYAGEEKVVCEGLKGSEHDAIVQAIDSFEAYGSTNGEGGINKAYEIAKKYFIQGGNNRVILATDGDLNVGISSEAGLIELIEEKKETGIFLSCLGFGDGNYQDAKMEALADHGNGNYAYIDCSREAERVLKDEFRSTLFTVAKDVKFQVEFNPAKVKAYRLVGYENRKMDAEDFANDAKDGGEVGSGQCVTALYEVVTVNSQREVPEVASRYNNDNKGSEGDELLTVNIRYKEPDENESKLLEYPVTQQMYSETPDEDTVWAAGVAQFGMLVRDSQYKGTSSYKGIYDSLKNDSRIFDDDLRAEFLYLISLVNKSEK